MSDIEGSVLAVPTANREAFITHAKSADSAFLECGATRVLECWGEDVRDGKLTDFRRAVQATPEETVVFHGSNGRTKQRATPLLSVCNRLWEATRDSTRK